MPIFVRVLTLSFLILTLSYSSAHAQEDTLRVLFLGNSYTNFNNLPTLCQELAGGAQKMLLVDSNTPGGYTLEQHAENATSLAKISAGNWDYVVLQEQSQIPTIDLYRYNSMYPAAQDLRDSILKYNPCARVVMYMTWGRRFGGQQCDNGGNCSPDFVDFTHMQDSLESAYTEIAELIDAYVSPVGVAWKKVIEETEIVLHTGDNSHPNYSGSFLAASVFHGVFWGESATLSNFSGSLSDLEATYFRQVADSTVFYGNDGWNLDVDQVVAGFDFDVFADSVQFINNSSSLEPTVYFWQFGDGSISSSENPTHTYAEDGEYEVTLIVNNCGRQDSITQFVNILTVGIPQSAVSDRLKVFPNPVADQLTIQFSQPQEAIYELMDATGQRLMVGSVRNADRTTRALGHLPAGLYILRTQVEGLSPVTTRIIKR